MTIDPWFDTVHRFGSDLVARTEGPLTFRLILQPSAALIMAIIDGLRDAKTGGTPYFWRITHADTVHRRSALREGLKSTARILVLGVVMEVIYQFKVYGGFNYLGETVVVVLVLCFVPYLLMRGPVNRLGQWWRHRRKS